MMIELGAYLNRHTEITAAADLGEDRLLLFPAGRVELFGMPDVLMDTAAAAEVIATFERRGVEVPVDYEHSTKIKAENGEPSPAAGWITGINWVPGRGLVGSVRWTSKARQQIADKEYQYLSPHFDVDRQTRRVAFVLAAALTNTPRISNMEKLIAASVAAATLSTKEDNAMKTYHERLVAALKLEGVKTEDEVLAAIEEAIPEGEAAEVAPEDAAVLAVKGLLLEIQRALMEANVIGAESSLADAMQAALDLIGTSSDETAEATASIVAALGIKTGSTAEQIVASINEKKGTTVPLAEFTKLKGEVDAIKTEREGREVEEVVASFVEQGRINPNSDKDMAWARQFAKADRSKFEEIAANMPVLYTSGQVSSGDDPIRSGRATIIASALKEFDIDNCGAGKKSYVNVALGEKELAPLDADEIKLHSIA